MATIRRFRFLLLSLVILIVACNELDRETARDIAAEDICAEADRCDNLGDDGLHPSHSDCIIEERKRFNDAWPEERCGDGAIDIEAFDRCVDSALEVACHDQPQDWLIAIALCNADNVCTN